MKITAEHLTKPRMFLAAVAVGIVIAVLVKLTRPAMEHQDLVASGTSAAFIDLQEYSVRPEIKGYGAVQPELAADIRTEVSGRVVYLNPELKKGEILPAGTMVIKIDDKDYRLALAKAEASLAQSRINLSDKKLQKTNIESDLKLAREKLTLSEKELKRSGSLFRKGALSESALERSRTSVLQQQQEVQKLITQRDSLPYLIELQQAQMEIAEAELAARRRDLERTTVAIPEGFAARVTQVNTEAEEFVSAGTTLFSIQGLEQVKVNAQVTVESFGKLLESYSDQPMSLEQMLFEADGNSIGQKVTRQLGLSAYVRLAGSEQPVWPARVARIDSNLDPATRTIGIIVTVDHPYQDIRPGVKPPLMEGMYMEVVLQGAAGQYMVIPKAAIHEKQVYQVAADNSLKRTVVKGVSQGEMLLIKPEQLDDKRIVSSDLFPAVDGMKLNLFQDQNTQFIVEHWLEGR